MRTEERIRVRGGYAVCPSLGLRVGGRLVLAARARNSGSWLRLVARTCGSDSRLPLESFQSSPASIRPREKSRLAQPIWYWFDSNWSDFNDVSHRWRSSSTNFPQKPEQHQIGNNGKQYLGSQLIFPITTLKLIIRIYWAPMTKIFIREFYTIWVILRDRVANIFSLISFFQQFELFLLLIAFHLHNTVVTESMDRFKFLLFKSCDEFAALLKSW